MAIVLPHVFQDGVGETASGVQVNENFNVLKAAIEALEAKLAGPYGARTVRGSGTNFTFEDTPSASRATFVILQLEKNGAAETLTLNELEVGGVQLPQQAIVGAGSQHKAIYSFVCPAGAKWKANVIAGAGGATLTSSYCPMGL